MPLTLTGAGVIAGGASLPTPPVASPLAWFRSDYFYSDTARTTLCVAGSSTVASARDLSGNGFHLSQSTAGQRPAYITDTGKNYASFDGVDDGLVNLDTAQLTKNLTIGFRVKDLSGTVGGVNMGGVTSIPPFASYALWCVNVFNTGGCQLQPIFRDEGFQTITQTYQLGLNQTAWLVVTYDSTTGGVALYRDGVLVVSDANPAISPANMTTNQAIGMGCLVLASQPGGVYQVAPVKFSEMIVYGSVLSGANLTALNAYTGP